jgi:hypothetical protein
MAFVLAAFFLLDGVVLHASPEQYGASILLAIASFWCGKADE